MGFSPAKSTKISLKNYLRLLKTYQKTDKKKFLIILKQYLGHISLLENTRACAFTKFKSLEPLEINILSNFQKTETSN